jgi:hypothetical protein
MILIENDYKLPVLYPKVYRRMLRRSAASHSTGLPGIKPGHILLSLFYHNLY